MKKTMLAFCSTAFILTGCVALQQDVVTLERRIETLERQSHNLQQQNENLNNQLRNDLSTLGANRESSEKNLGTQY